MPSPSSDAVQPRVLLELAELPSTSQDVYLEQLKTQPTAIKRVAKALVDANGSTSLPWPSCRDEQCQQSTPQTLVVQASAITSSTAPIHLDLELQGESGAIARSAVDSGDQQPTLLRLGESGQPVVATPYLILADEDLKRAAACHARAEAH